MKLFIKKLYFPHSIDHVIDSLFKIPQLNEHFDKGVSYEGNIMPRGAKIYPGFWDANKIMKGLDRPERGVLLVLTSLDLKGDYGRIHGKGHDGVAIISSNGYTGGWGFNPRDISFNAMAYGEIGHALGLKHHEIKRNDSCAMTHNFHPHPDWKSLEDIRFCDGCYSGL